MNDKLNFQELIAQLSDEELLGINRKIYAEEVDFFIDYLPAAPSRMDLINILYQLIDQLSPLSLNKILKSRDFILNQELKNPSEEFDTIINNIIRLSSKYRTDLQFSTVLRAIDNSVTTPKNKLKFAIYLSNIQAVDKGVFETIVEKHNYLLPSLINRIKFSHPMLGLNYLDEYIDAADKKIVKPIVRTLLLSFLSLDPFSSANYKEFVFFLDNIQKQTLDLINEILSLEQLSPIKDKLELYTSDLIEMGIGEVFFPDELEKANKLVLNSIQKNEELQIKGKKHVEPTDISSYSVGAVVFAMVTYIGHAEDYKISLMGELFLEFNKVYTERFHAYLRKYRATYDPIDHGVLISNRFYQFTIEPKIWMASQEVLNRKFGDKRVEKLKEITSTI